jgi:hypothetical protein
MSSTDKYFCWKCRKPVPYEIAERPAKIKEDNFETNYTEYYGICCKCKTEILVPDLEDRNQGVIERIYNERRNLKI